VVAVTQGTHGSVVLNPDFTVTYSPTTNAYYGSDTFTYTVSDGTAQTVGHVAITITRDTVPPTVSGPSIAKRAAVSGATFPYTLSWSGSDAQTGVKEFRVETKVTGGTWKRVYTGLATSLTGTAPYGKVLYARVRAVDLGDTASAWSLHEWSVVAVQSTASSVVKTGSWSVVKSAHALGGSYLKSTKKGSSLTYSFKGYVSVGLVASKTTNAGSIRILVDGVSKGTFSLAATRSTSTQLILLAAVTGSATKTHTIQIVSTSAKWVDGDAFVFLRVVR
jgi:hypothetical protein